MENSSSSHHMTKERFELLSMDKKITEKEIENFLREKKINFDKIEFFDLDDKTRNVRVTFDSDALIYTQLEITKGQTFPKHDQQVIKIHFLDSSNNQLTYIKPPQENEIISYSTEYDKLIMNEYEKKLGADGLVYKNLNVIEKQRSVAGYLIKNIGLNLIKGKSIMNISLPINIFDERSLLELFCCQNAYAAILLEKGGLESKPIEKIKYSTAFAITKFHLSGAQLKPFNPILGETFQCKIRDTEFFLEQTSHHPPISNFYAIGKNYKIYGYNESEASTGANSVKVYYKGNFIVEYSDGTIHKIVFPDIKLAGTMVGERSLKFRGKLFVIDEKNDLISYIHLDPDERGFFKKLTSKKQTNPDFLKGIVTNISKNTKFDKKEKIYSINSQEKHILTTVEGEFTKDVKFDGVTYWEYGFNGFPELRRMKNTLLSDSMYREDLIWLKNGDQDMSQKFKVKLEEIQRNDKKLREARKKK